jgi:small subunit ribosomal protein S2
MASFSTTEGADSETSSLDADVVTNRYDDSYTVTELRAIAKDLGITGYSTLNKAQLLEVLNGID